MHAALRLPLSLLASALFAATPLLSQPVTCPVIPAHDLTPAEQAYHDGHYAHAEDLFGADLAQHPQDTALLVALLRTQFREGKLTEAAARLQPALDAAPHAAPLLTEQAELQFRQGQPRLALQTLDAASAADPCYARAHLIRARILRVNYMHASERSEISAANRIDPTDIDIHRAWANIVNAAEQAREIQKDLAAPSADPEVKRIGEPTFTSYVHQLVEHSETCHLVSNVPSASFALPPFMKDGRTVYGYGLEVQLGSRKATFSLDSGDSGLFITRALADELGLQRGANAEGNTVHLDVLHVGPLEFHDCTVGVSEQSFGGKLEGFISTDLFTHYLIDINYPARKLELSPLPPLPPDPLVPAGFPVDDDTRFPGDRYVPAEFKDYSPVYRSKGYLLLPVTLNHKAERLFVLDTGVARTAMTAEAAHEVSKTHMNFTNPQTIAGGGTIQVYREPYTLQLANLAPTDARGIVEFNPEIMNHNVGFSIAGLLGFDVLNNLEIHIDYRDGLIRFDSPVYGVARAGGQPTDLLASASGSVAPACSPVATDPSGQRYPILHAGAVSYVDASQIKPGQIFYLKSLDQWTGPTCKLIPGAIIKGRILAASPAKGGKTSELALLLDRADCEGHHDAALNFQVAAVVNSVTDSPATHAAVPVEVRGGGRAIGDAVVATGNQTDINHGVQDDTNLKEGDVRGLAATTLDMTGGPQCSSRLVATGHSVRIEKNSELLLELRN